MAEVMKITIKLKGRTVGYIVAEGKNLFGIKVARCRGYVATFHSLGKATAWVRNNLQGKPEFVP